jgi:hypothetical protein
MPENGPPPPGISPELWENPKLCTLDTCPLSMAQVHYRPSVAGNTIYLALFGIVFFVQVFFGIKHKTWGFMTAMLFGLLLEIIGYVSRLQIYANPFASGPFLSYLVTLTIAPAFLSAAIYLCLSRIIVAFSPRAALFKPKTYTFIFISFDFVALLLQAVGGAIASSSDKRDDINMGKNIMLAGVIWQVISLAIFAGLCTQLFLRIRKMPDSQFNPTFDALRKTTKFRNFLWSLGIATVAIFIRSVFRCAELSGGFDGHLANDEITFMLLEGLMILNAVSVLTIWHPGVVFGGLWSSAKFKFRGVKTVVEDVDQAEAGDYNRLEPYNGGYNHSRGGSDVEITMPLRSQSPQPRNH